MNDPDFPGKPEGYEESLTIADRETDDEEGRTLVFSISEDKTLLDSHNKEKTLPEHDRAMSGTWSVREVIDSLYRVEKILTGGMGIRLNNLIKILKYIINFNKIYQITFIRLPT